MPALRPLLTGLASCAIFSTAAAQSWYEKMDLGPIFTSSLVAEHETGEVMAYKAMSLQLGKDRQATVVFDTETVSMIAGFKGFIELEGTPWSGAHGSSPFLSSRGAGLIFQTPRLEPGWARKGKFDDPRAIPHGPIPADWAKFRGVYRHGNQTVLSYTVGEVEVLEMPDHHGDSVLTRAFNFGKRTKPITLRVATAFAGQQIVISEQGVVAVAAPNRATTSNLLQPDANGLIVLGDRTDGEWDQLVMGAPSAEHLQEVDFRAVTAIAEPHNRAGAEGDRLPRLGDGKAAANDDDLEHNSWFDARTARVTADLGRVIDLGRVNTFSWHRRERGPHAYTLWGSAAETMPDAASKDPAAAGWKRVAEVSTYELGEGGKHGSTISGKIGEHRFLLWVLDCKNGANGSFLSEIDVIPATAENLPPLRLPEGWGGPNTPLLAGLIGAGAQFEASGADLLLKIPDGDPLKLKLALSRGARQSFEGISEAEDLSLLTKGGPSLWPETVVVSGSLGKAKPGESYVNDVIPVPVQNSFNSSIRFGCFDFFSDGTRAAACTWNGEVWIASGIDEDLDQVAWRRFAVGLFEPLGLRIVDDLVYVQGRDGITRLHDLNGDGEADFHESFNNDVQITESFHEFQFGLETDAAGNFYFGKAAPVRAGGRGFYDIVPHHGTVLKVSKDGSESEVIATGLRAPGGIGVSPDGIVTTGENEGSWVPRCKITWNRPNKITFNGVVPCAHLAREPKTYDKPLCWLPYAVDNSSGGQAWVHSEKWGAAHNDELLHLSYGTAKIYRVLREHVDGQIQGGVYKIADFGSSAMRARFNPRDGQLYVIGFRGWQSSGRELCAFERIRFTGEEAVVPTKMKMMTNGIYLGFNGKLDPASAVDITNYEITKWNYVWGPQYGSGRFSIDRRDEAKEKWAIDHSSKGNHDVIDPVIVKTARLLEDGTALFIEVENMTKAMQMQIKMNLQSADGKPVEHVISNTVHTMAAPDPKLTGGCEDC